MLAEHILAEVGVRIIDNMQICVDSLGYLYKLPVSVINEPKTYKEKDELANLINPSKSKIIRVTLKS